MHRALRYSCRSESVSTAGLTCGRREETDLDLRNLAAEHDLDVSDPSSGTTSLCTPLHGPYKTGDPGAKQPPRPWRSFLPPPDSGLTRSFVAGHCDGARSCRPPWTFAETARTDNHREVRAPGLQGAIARVLQSRVARLSPSRLSTRAAHPTQSFCDAHQPTGERNHEAFELGLAGGRRALPSCKDLYIDRAPSRPASSRRALLNVHPEVPLVSKPCKKKRDQRASARPRTVGTHIATRNATARHRPTCH